MSHRIRLFVTIASVSLMLFCNTSNAAEVTARNVRAEFRDGQTFVTWADAATGEEGVPYRYSLYRSDRPITSANLAEAELCSQGIAHHSGRLFGSAFNTKDRLDPTKKMTILAEGAEPLPIWSGLAVRTVRKNGPSYYAVVTTDDKLKPLSTVTPGVNATTEAVAERVEPIRPIKIYDSRQRTGPYVPQTQLTGTKKLPLHLDLHGSTGQGGGASDYGDYYLYFGSPDMGYRDGVPGVFSIEERREKPGNRLHLRVRDAIEHPTGTRALETFWFGYYCVPQGATHTEPRAYPYTERRLEWILDFITKTYDIDTNRVTVAGGSMGAWGSTTYAFRHPERFAVVYPNRPRTRQRGLPNLTGQQLVSKGADLPSLFLDDGQTNYFARMDMVRFATEHAEDLPFYAWCCGRRDGFASWQEQVDMARALTEAHHGFAFAWNNGDHSSGATPMAAVTKWYPPERLARNVSYPAFGRSSIDQNPGPGDPAMGDLEGGMNLGFRWDAVVDMKEEWSVTLTNELAPGDMTVDVTPRRCQSFRVAAGARVHWASSTGAKGMVVADRHGLVTVPAVLLKKSEPITLTLTLAAPATSSCEAATAERSTSRGAEEEVGNEPDCQIASAGSKESVAPVVVDSPLREEWDYVPKMKGVAAKFKGREGVVIHVGGSMTIANPYGTWPRQGKGKTPADEAILKWMHTDKKDKTDGWWLCRTEIEHYRAYTSESGLKSEMLLKGGKRGLPVLSEILADYQPRIVTLECGIYDVEDGVPLETYRKNMEQALDQILAAGAIPIVNTIPPFQAQLARTKEFNVALRVLAKSRGLPVIDLEREILTRRPNDWFGPLMKRIHLTASEGGGNSGAEPTPENLAKSGYQLRGWLTVRKVDEIKRRVLDAQ